MRFCMVNESQERSQDLLVDWRRRAEGRVTVIELYCYEGFVELAPETQRSKQKPHSISPKFYLTRVASQNNYLIFKNLRKFSPDNKNTLTS